MTDKLQTFNLIDPRLNALKQQQDKLKYAIPQGASYTNRVAQKANSYSSSGMSWNFNSQGQNVLIDRRFYIKTQFQVSITGVPKVGAYLYTPDQSAPRDFPLTHIAENVSLTLNGSSVSMNYADALTAFKRYNTDMNLTQVDLTGCPTFMDKYAQYASGLGSNRNALATFQSSGAELGRGSFHLDSVVGNTVGDGVASKTVVVKFTTVEPLFLSPLLYSSRHLDAGLLGVNNIGININFSGNLDRVWSQSIADLVVSGSTVSATLGSGTTLVPELLVEYLNVPTIEGSQIPESVLYEYNRVETYSNNLSATLAPGASGTFINNAIQLSVSPKKIYIYATTPRGSKTADDTDTFLPITSLSLQYLNVAGQFSSMTQNDLFNMSVKNGLQMSFQEFSGRTGGNPNNTDVALCGSVLCIDTTDLALPSNISSGVLVNSQLQFQIGLSNFDTVAKAVNIYVVVCNEGIFEIGNGSASNMVGVVSAEQVMETRLTGENVDKQGSGNMMGAGLWDDFKSLVSKVPDVINVGKDVYDTGKKVVGVAKNLMGKGVHKGMGLVGGQRMTKEQLKMMLE